MSTEFADSILDSLCNEDAAEQIIASSQFPTEAYRNKMDFMKTGYVSFPYTKSNGTTDGNKIMFKSKFDDELGMSRYTMYLRKVNPSVKDTWHAIMDKLIIWKFDIYDKLKNDGREPVKSEIVELNGQKAQNIAAVIKSFEHNQTPLYARIREVFPEAIAQYKKMKRLQ